MTISSRKGLLLVVSSACLAAAAGCGAASTDSPIGQAPPDKSGTLLASVTTQAGHTVDFRELESGSLAVSETCGIDETPVLKSLGAARSLVDIYRLVQPNAEAPQALVDAVGRLNALRAKAPPASLAPPPAAELVRGPVAHPETQAQQTWFKETYCTGFRLGRLRAGRDFGPVRLDPRRIFLGDGDGGQRSDDVVDARRVGLEQRAGPRRYLHRGAGLPFFDPLRISGAGLS